MSRMRNLVKDRTNTSQKRHDITSPPVVQQPQSALENVDIFDAVEGRATRKAAITRGRALPRHRTNGSLLNLSDDEEDLTSMTEEERAEREERILAAATAAARKLRGSAATKRPIPPRRMSGLDLLSDGEDEELLELSGVSTNANRQVRKGVVASAFECLNELLTRILQDSAINLQPVQTSEPTLRSVHTVGTTSVARTRSVRADASRRLGTLNRNKTRTVRREVYL